MEIKEFSEEIKKVQNFYGKPYSDIQITEMFKYFSNTTIARFRYIISKAYQTYTYLPSLAQLVEVQKNTPFYTPKKAQQETEVCKICGGKGFKTYTRIDPKSGYSYEYVAHCECVNSYNYRFDGKKVKDDKCKSDYYIKSYKNVLDEKEK